MTSRHFGRRLQPRPPVRDILLSNYVELSKEKKKMKIRQLGPNYKRNYPLSTPRKIWKVH